MHHGNPRILTEEQISDLCMYHFQFHIQVLSTGCSIKIQSHYFNLTSSHKRDAKISKLHSFSTIQGFLLRYITLYQVNWFRNGKLLKLELHRESLEKGHFTISKGYILNFLNIFGVAAALFQAAKPTWVSFGSTRSKKTAQKFRLQPVRLVKCTFSRLFYLQFQL